MVLVINKSNYTVTSICFSTKPKKWLGRTSPQWPILCRVGL